ncbi:MAG TPA: Rne/Rng family ribonuclease [Vicinamibacteria bacterium]|nr:Rne/Rng family ribonuclease [Vicinamibacteria bacterium]
MTKDLIVCSTPQETRVALLEDGHVSEIFIERESHRGTVGNIYKGRVTRVLPGMQSAFVDCGLERDAFLYVADVIEGLDENLLSEEEKALSDGAPAGAGAGPGAGGGPNGGGGNGGHRASIDELLHEGQEVIVQVVKEALGQKGARITSHVSLPGRYLVFMPTVEHVGVSRKISDDEERRRLKTILKELRQERGGGGFIARTAGLGRSREDFDRDARYLGRTWDEVRAVGSRQSAPTLLHRELGLVQRLLRDLLSDDVGAIRLDNEKEFNRTLELVKQLQPELAPRVRLHTKPQSILEEYGVTGELERALRSKVWLDSGGYIVINQTEALVAVDVNTGRYTGQKRLEETILQTNLEAVTELVRQIRLRDLGGIIVVDFIDMEEKKSRQKVMAMLEQELKRDRSPSKLLSVNEFGLVILTRKRVRQSLERTLCQPCPYCTGSGMIKNVSTVCTEIYDEVRKLASDLHGKGVGLRVNPEVGRALQGEEAPLLQELARMLGGEVTVHADPLLHQEQFDVVPR